MLDLYEKCCDESDEDTYWGADNDHGPTVEEADDTNEVVRDDGF